MPGQFEITSLLSFRANVQSLASAKATIQTALNGTTANIVVNVQAAAIANARTQLNSVTSAANSASAAAGGLSRSLGGLAAGVVGVGTLAAALRRAATDAIAFDAALNKFRQLSDAGGQVRAVSAEVGRLSSSLGVSGLDLARQAVALRQAGVSAKDTATALRAVGEASLSVGFDEVGQAGASAAAVFRTFGHDVSSLREDLGAMAAVAKASGAGANDLAAAVKSGGAAFKASSGDLREFIALSASLKSVTGDEGGAVGSGLGRLVARLSLPGASTRLKELGIDLEGATGAYEKLQRVSAGVARFGPEDPRRASALDALGGARAFGKVLPLLQNMAEAQRLLNVARTGGAQLDVAAAIASDSYSTRLARVREEALNLTRVMGEGRGGRIFVELLERGAEAALKLAGPLSSLLPLLAAAGAARGLGALAGGVGGLSGRGRAIGAAGLAAVGVGLAQPAFDSFGPTGSGVGGGIQGALLGGVAGSAFGPFGIAAGAATGALVGFSSALADARKGLIDARIDQLQVELNSQLDLLVSGASPAAQARTNAATSSLRVSARDRAEVGSGGFFGQFFDSGAYLKSVQGEDRKASGLTLGKSVAALNALAESLGKRSPGGSSENLSREFQAGAGPLLRVVADTSGKTREASLKEFVSVITSAQRTATGPNAIALGIDRQATAYGRLTAVVERVQADIAGLGHEAQALAGILSGDVAAARPAAFDPTDPAGLARLTGLGDAGKRLADDSAALDRLAEVLPAALAQLGASNPTEGDALDSRLRDLLQSALGGGPLTGATGRAVDAITSRASEKKPEDIMKGIEGDVSKLADELLSAFAGPIEQTRKRLSELAQSNATQLADGLANAARAGQTIGQERDSVAAAKLASLRVGAAIAEDRTGRPANDALPLSELLRPFQERAERLTGFAGAKATDPDAIAGKLSAVRQDIVKATADQAAGGKSAYDAAKRLQDLQSSAVNLQSALKGLADSSTRAAAIQERLSALSQNRDSRLGYAERYLTADPAMQMKMKRGQSLVSAVDNGAKLGDLTAEERRLFFDAARDLGATRLRSGRTAADVARLATGAVPGVLNAGQEAERRGLQNQNQAVADTAVKAQGLLVTGLETTHKSYLDKLAGLHSVFFDRLAGLLTKESLTTKTVELGETGRKLGDLKAAGAGAALLRQAGVTTDTQVGTLQANRADLTAYSLALEKRKANTESLVAAAGADLSGFAPGVKRRKDADGRAALDQASETLDKAFPQLTPDQRTGALQKYAAAVRERNTPNDELIKSYSAKGVALDPALRDILRESARQEIRSGSPDKDIDKQRERFGALGFDPVKLEGQLAGGPGFFKALDGFDQAGNKLSTLSARLTDTAARFADLQGAVRSLQDALLTVKLQGMDAPLDRAAVGVPADFPGFATGGWVGKEKFRGEPRGSDTVAAMLTPGEHVTNAKSAKANRRLLERINRAGGPLYLADGGLVDFDPFVPLIPVQNPGPEPGPVERRAALAAAFGGDPSAPSRGVYGMGTYDVPARRPRPRRTPSPAIAANAVLSDYLRSDARALAYQQAVYRGGAGTDAGLNALGQRRVDAQSAFLSSPAGRATYMSRARGMVGDFASAAALKAERERRRKARGFANGGIVDGPDGIDRVGPAWLTAGEYVVPRNAVQRIGAANLDRVAHFAQGGLVGGASPSSGPGAVGQLGMSGEALAALQQFAGTAEKLGTAFGVFGGSADRLSTALTGFTPAATKLADALDKFVSGVPAEIRLTVSGTQDVVINGADALAAINPMVLNLVNRGIAEAIPAAFESRIPDAGPGRLRSDPTRVT